MQVILAGQILADWTTPLSAEDIDGQCLVQETDIVRAVQRAIRYRGNETVTFRFTITLQFATLAAREAYALTYFSTLTKQGGAAFNCGWGADDPDLTVVSASNCVLQGIRFGKPDGCTVTATFTLVFGAAATGTLPGTIPPTPGLIMQLISVTLAPGATTWSFTYPTPFTTACAPSVSMICPGSGDAITCWITSSTLTGCSGALSAPIPSSPSGYAVSGNVAGS